ncbi:MAG: alpha/beta hydrolase, partial [Vicinamibacterales bacterium]
GLAAIVGALDNLDLRPMLGRITCPTLVIGGDADLTFPVAQTRDLAARIAGARLVVIPGGSHGLVLEHAQAVAEQIAGLVDEVERSHAGAQA